MKIVETTSGTVTSTKQFVRAGQEMGEARDSAGSITAQYFGNGQTIGGSSYFYTKDRLGSIREMTDSLGGIQAQYSYDSYGRVSKVQGSLASDFQYAGYYLHAPSGLNLTLNRAYSCSLARWINRDPIQEKGGINLYDYVSNEPTIFTDPTGLGSDCGPPFRTNKDCRDFCDSTYKNFLARMQCYIWCNFNHPPLIPNPDWNPHYQIPPGTFVTPPGNAFVPIPIPGTPYYWPGVNTPLGPFPLVPIWVPGTPIFVPI